MLNLPSKTHCDTFVGIQLTMPLLIGMEFSRKPTPSQQDDWQCLEQLKEEQGWVFNLQTAKPYLEGRMSAVVITDAAQQITWVSKGFTRMTGYGFDEAYHKKPSFLQGEKTSPEIRQEIRQQLSRRNPYAGTIINYRKSGLPYLCNVHIIPLLNQANQLVNFMALEKEATWLV
ncbi:hypothetical protein GCM10027275_27150 [Rhabdobacter roseus]|uniref:PAS domain S-box-containing protein n=1 Tax=Rhabdobacter roseus TaxID=1655419 RepID=A0A840TM37_9BACT|nr:PAS domain-containing protein [Rhabdobacter roseus]MBB5284661.1 PAS domain S-box-containing protein [Rhabdobacter roseus]